MAMRNRVHQLVSEPIDSLAAGEEEGPQDPIDSLAAGEEEGPQDPIDDGIRGLAPDLEWHRSHQILNERVVILEKQVKDLASQTSQIPLILTQLQLLTQRMGKFQSNQESSQVVSPSKSNASGERTYKKGRNFENGLVIGDEDDDGLVLFNEMQDRERDEFLVHTFDVVDDSLSKLGYLSDCKIGISTPARGDSSDLLNVDDERSDYEWLLTPPETPPFHSLDDEEPQPQNLQPQGRLRIQPINISKSLFMDEKNPRNSRSSATPHRFSPSLRSGDDNGQFQLSPSPAPRSSSLSSQRSSIPPNKPSRATSRLWTPTLRRMSTGCSVQAPSSGRRGTSPIKASQGSSKKFGGWQSDLPSSASDAPSNLRTSPLVRGPSQTPRRGRGRQSLSPTASRRTNSSYNNERDKFISFSKGSEVSLRTSPANSLPKRSFKPVLHKMDHRKTQNMFRPLLSGVPATTMDVRNANSTYMPVSSRNSSVTTSTSSNSDQCFSVAPNIDASGHDQNDLARELEQTQDPETQEEVSVFDNVDNIVEDNDNEVHTGKPFSGSGNFEGSTVNFSRVSNIATAADSTYASANFSLVFDCVIEMVCSTCGKSYHLLGLDGETNVCQECLELDEPVSPEHLPSSTEAYNQTVQSEVIRGMDVSVDQVEGNVGISKSPERQSIEAMLSHHEHTSEHDCNCMDNNCPRVMDQLELQLSNEQSESQQSKSNHMSNQCDSETIFILQGGGAISSTNIFCSDPCYVRDNNEAIKNNILLDNSSAFSSTFSLDLESFRQTEVQIRCQNACARNDTDANSQHFGLAIGASEPSIRLGSDMEKDYNNVTNVVDVEVLQEPNLFTERDRTFDDINMSTYNLKDEDCILCINADEDPWRVSEKAIEDIKVSKGTPDSSILLEESVLNGASVRSEISEVTINCSSLAISESQNDCDSNVEALHEPSVLTTSEKGMIVSTSECELLDHAHDVHEEMAVVVKGPSEHMLRSITLDEATNTILFCSSIVHDIACKAAAIGMEKDSVLGKIDSNSDQNSRKMHNKSTPKSRKFRRRKLESRSKSPLTELQTNVIVHESTQPMNIKKIQQKAIDSTNPPKLESKCNCTVM